MWNVYTQIGAALLAVLALVAIYQNRKSIPKPVWTYGPMAVAGVVSAAVFWVKIMAFGALAFGTVMSLVPSWATVWQCFAVGLGVASFAVAIVISSAKVPEGLLPMFSRIPVFCWFGSVFSALMAAAPNLKEASGFTLLALAVCLMMAVLPCIKVIPDFKAGVVVMGKKPVRSSGSGWVFIFRPFGFNFEDIVKVFAVKKTAINDAMITVELGGPDVKPTDKDYAKLEFTFEFQPDESNYVVYQSFDPAKLEQTLLDHLEGFATDAFKGVANIQELYEKLEEKELEIAENFRKIQSRFGVTVIAVTIDDVAVDENLLKERVERQNKLKAAELEVEIEKKKKQQKTIQLKQIRDEAAKLVKDNPTLTPKEALERVQVSLGIVKESKQTFDIGGGLQSGISNVLSTVLEKRFGGGESREEKGPIGFPKKKDSNN